MLTNASTSLFAALDAFWPTRPGWDVLEANLVAHLHAAARAEGSQAYLEVPLEVLGQSGKRLDLLVIPTDDSQAVRWVEVKRIWANGQGHDIAADLQRLTEPSTSLGRALPDRLEGRPVRALFVALTHQPDVADWWLDATGELPRPFQDAVWTNPVASILGNALHRKVFAHHEGRPRPSFVVTAEWAR